MCALLFLVILRVPGWTGREGCLSICTDSAFCQFCPMLASSSAARKMSSEQTIYHRVNEKQCCGMALELSVEASWLGNVGKLPPLWPHAHISALNCTLFPDACIFRVRTNADNTILEPKVFVTLEVLLRTYGQC